VFSVVWSINLHNFMDGIDGLLATQALFVLATFAVIACAGRGVDLALDVVVAAAIVGFLPSNAPRATIFMGDVGSGALGYLIFEAFLGPMGDSPLWTRFWYNYAVQVVPRLWVFGTVYAMALAISYSSDVRQREEEIVGLRALAQETQLRALRSQLNPHFLFNALNSIAALIRDGKSEQAEAVTEDVADFLRITVTLDPQRLITLGEEAALQRLYLDIQKVRFPTRLNIIFDIGPTVEDALVPNLILQPLVENSIKHAVAQSTEPVTVRVSASADGSKLRVLVEDDGGNAASGGAASGSSIGLVNVAQRLTAHFGSSATLTSVPTDEGGYRNLIVMPLRRSS